jgi:MoaA/NifB/PqqE/SkfB family radical SAM enzyme
LSTSRLGSQRAKLALTKEEEKPKEKKSDMDRYLGAILSMLESKLFTHKPFFLAHAITYNCNSKCKTCTYWKMSSRTTEDLNTEGVFNLLDETYDFGMRGYYLFGGEPTVREDIGQVVDYAKKKGFITTMNTNASLLAPKAESLRNLDFVFVSLDYFNGYHDFIRGRRGAFDEVIKGINGIRATGKTRVTLVTTISTLNPDAIEPMANLARDLKVGISYNSVEPTVQASFEAGRVESPVHNYGLTMTQLRAFYDSLLKLKQEGYPLMETEYVLKHFTEERPWICQFPKMFVYVSPDKKIFSCTYDHTYDLKQGSFKDYFSSRLYQKHVAKAEKCNICVRTCVRGYSYAYDLNPLNFMNLIGDARILLDQKTNAT